MAQLTIDTSVPNAVLELRMTTIIVGPKDGRPTHIGVVDIHTEQGIIPVVINRKAAAALMHELTDFLAAEEDEPVVAAND